MDRRATKRMWIQAPVLVRAHDCSWPAIAYDISTNGCVVESEAWSFEAGDPATIRFRDFVSAKGRVVWVKHRNAGIQFEKPLRVPVVEAIVSEGGLPRPQAHWGRKRGTMPYPQPCHLSAAAKASEFPVLAATLGLPNLLLYRVHYTWCVALLLACIFVLSSSG